MPPRKTAAKPDAEVAEEKVAAPAKPTAEPAEDTGPGSYADAANAIAAEARALADDTRARIAALQAECDDLGQQDREVSDAPVWDGVRRVKMATDDTARTLDGLTAVAADLATRAQT